MSYSTIPLPMFGYEAAKAAPDPWSTLPGTLTRWDDDGALYRAILSYEDRRQNQHWPKLDAEGVYGSVKRWRAGGFEVEAHGYRPTSSRMQMIRRETVDDLATAEARLLALVRECTEHCDTPDPEPRFKRGQVVQRVRVPDSCAHAAGRRYVVQDAWIGIGGSEWIAIRREGSERDLPQADADAFVLVEGE